MNILEGLKKFYNVPYASWAEWQNMGKSGSGRL